MKNDNYALALLRRLVVDPSNEEVREEVRDLLRSRPGEEHNQYSVRITVVVQAQDRTEAARKAVDYVTSGGVGAPRQATVQVAPQGRTDWEAFEVSGLSTRPET